MENKMDNNKLMSFAKDAMKNSYAKLTNYSVGAALICKSGKVYIGVNIEEYAIPGLSNCAERVAIQTAISNGERDFEKIAIIGGKFGTDNYDDTLIPCGVCLQYMLDIVGDINVVTYINGNLVEKPLKEFLAYPFELKNQNKN